MGSFYSTCSVSGMTLTRQKTSILLVSPSYSTGYSEHRNMVVSNEGCMEFFTPFGFPINGVYYDYGNITDIERNGNVRILEDYFGIDIETILENIGREIPEGIKNSKTYESLGMTYFRTEVLEYLERGWDKIDISSPKKYSFESYLSEILKSLSSRNTFMGKDRYEFLRSKLKEKNITEEERDELMDHLTKDIGFRTYIPSLTKYDMFKELRIGLEFKEEICKQYMMIRMLGSRGLNRLLVPSNYGSQEDNWTETYRFNSFVNDLLVEDMNNKIGSHSVWGPADDGYLIKEKEIVREHQSIVRDRKINQII